MEKNPEYYLCIKYGHTLIDYVYLSVTESQFNSVIVTIPPDFHIKAVETERSFTEYKYIRYYSSCEDNSEEIFLGFKCLF